MTNRQHCDNHKIHEQKNEKSYIMNKAHWIDIVNSNL